ncbi:hypothetical protein T09_121, partial [Trichinella sp. T9]
SFLVPKNPGSSDNSDIARVNRSDGSVFVKSAWLRNPSDCAA